MSKATFNRIVRPQTQGMTQIGGGRIKLAAKVPQATQSCIGTPKISGPMTLDDCGKVRPFDRVVKVPTE